MSIFRRKKAQKPDDAKTAESNKEPNVPYFSKAHKMDCLNETLINVAGNTDNSIKGPTIWAATTGTIGFGMDFGFRVISNVFTSGSFSGGVKAAASGTFNDLSWFYNAFASQTDGVRWAGMAVATVIATGFAIKSAAKNASIPFSARDAYIRDRFNGFVDARKKAAQGGLVCNAAITEAEASELSGMFTAEYYKGENPKSAYREWAFETAKTAAWTFVVGATVYYAPEICGGAATAYKGSTGTWAFLRSAVDNVVAGTPVLTGAGLFAAGLGLVSLAHKFARPIISNVLTLGSAMKGAVFGNRLDAMPRKQEKPDAGPAEARADAVAPEGATPDNVIPINPGQQEDDGGDDPAPGPSP